MEPLNLKDLPEAIIVHWDTSMLEIPDDIYFLNENFIRQSNCVFHLPEQVISLLIVEADKIKNTRRLTEIAWFCYFLIFECQDFSKQDESNMAELVIWMESIDGMFPVIILISGLPLIKRYYSQKGISEEIMEHTLSDLNIWIKHHHDVYGEYGLKETSWLINHFTCEIYRLERLQFIFTKFNGDVRVFKNISTGDVTSISEEGIEYRKDGQVTGTNNIFDREGPWTSFIEENEEFVRGNPIKNGVAYKDTITLCRLQWKEVLRNGDLVLDVHIPEGEKLCFDKCLESFKQAVDFFKRYFPHRTFMAFTCCSWLLDFQLQNMISDKSNIIRLQKKVHLYPVLSDDEQTFERVFGGRPSNNQIFPSYTQLQKAILEYTATGRKMHSGAMFLLKSEI